MAIETVNSTNLLHKNTNTVAKNDTKSSTIKADLVKSPEKDKFEKIDTKNQNTEPKQTKKHSFAKICLGIAASLVAIYGAVVLKHKLAKPSFDEVKKCFEEIFGKQFSKEETESLIKKYREICNTESLEKSTQKLFTLVKQDYGIEELPVGLRYEKLKDGKLSTFMERKTLGDAGPIVKNINIYPRTNSESGSRNARREVFGCVFHELQHKKQFVDAYRANPDEFCEAIVEMKRNAISKREIDPKRLKEFADAHNVSVEEYTKMMEEYIKGNSIYADVSEDLAEIYGQFSPYEKGSEAYKRGMKYIEAIRNYSTSDYAEYKNNLLEKEAFSMTDKAEKIFDYMTSIWKI